MKLTQWLGVSHLDDKCWPGTFIATFSFWTTGRVALSTISSRMALFCSIFPSPINGELPRQTQAANVGRAPNGEWVPVLLLFNGRE